MTYVIETDGRQIPCASESLMLTIVSILAVNKVPHLVRIVKG